MVVVIKTLKDFLEARKVEIKAIGFVPTMGNLHAGHISLLEQGLQDFDTVYFSIFVNPKQFGPNEDFNKYPRTLEDDLAKIDDCVKKHPAKKVVLFAPADPSEVFADENDMNISVAGIKDILEGEVRPGHFDGVATVVYRLFDLIKPQRAYFGLKDYQQLLVIRMMTKDLALPVEIVGMPIVRESSGLAMSSRNQYLTPEERSEGLTISRTLRELSTMIASRKENLSLAQAKAKEILKDSRWNYLEIRDGETLSADLTNARKIVLLGVFQLRSTRLLDNLEVSLNE